MRKLLWIGDAAVSSGFARVTHHVLEVLKETWEVHVLGLNYQGDPHKYSYPIYPCWIGGDLFGLGRIPDMASKLGPDVIIAQNDPWNIPAYLEKAGNVPVIASMPVDGKNCRGRGLNGLKLGIFWTKFGLQQARDGGYAGPATVIPLGVDLDVYYYRNRKDSREKVGLPKRVHDVFIVGNINRNQPRKRLDLTISYFAEWVKSHDIQDAYLFLHVAPTGDKGYDVSQLMQYYGLSNKLILAEPDIGLGVEEDRLVDTYGAFDVQLTTTQGEGWGLCTMEGMACGIPQIVPDWAALGEWTEDAVFKVPCTEISCTPNKINVVGGIADREATIQALQDLYVNSDLREVYQECGFALVKKPEYRWPQIGEMYRDAIEEALYPERTKQQLVVAGGES